MRPKDEIESGRYQDYVIKDGQMIGEFDLMYRKFPDPWGCGADSASIQNDLLCTLLKRVADEVNTVLDVGCGLGALTGRIKAVLEPVRVCAIDISETAIEEASGMYPDIDFRVHNLLKDPFHRLPHNLDIITMAEVCWYIIPDISRVLDGLYELLRLGGHLAIPQHFYHPDEQQYGNEVMTAPNDLIKLLEKSRFQVVREVLIQLTPPNHVFIWARKMPL